MIPEMIIATILTFVPLFFLRQRHIHAPKQNQAHTETSQQAGASKQNQAHTETSQQASAPAVGDVPGTRAEDMARSAQSKNNVLGAHLFLKLMTRRASFVFLVFFMLIFACYIALYFCIPGFCDNTGIAGYLLLPEEALIGLGYALGFPSAVALIRKKGSFTGGITAAVLSQLSLCLLVGNAADQLTYHSSLLLYGATSASFFIIIPCILRDYFGIACFTRIYIILAPLWLLTFWAAGSFVSSIPSSYPTYGNVMIFFLITLAFGALFLFLAWEKRFAIVRFAAPRRRRTG